MSHTTRRTFMMTVVAGTSALAAARTMAQALPKLDEADAQAAALGYKADSTKVDQKKYPTHAAANNCANCQLYQGKPNEATGACTLFAGKQVAAAGWCSAWNKKAG